MGGSKKQTIGYKYYLGIHMVLCHGPVDEISKIRVDKRVAWEGTETGGPITVSAEDLFGGEKKEGGVSGVVDIDMGEPTQTKNTYLQTQLGTDIPAFRGLVSAILNKCYVTNNPYLKNWAFTASRIYKTSDGAAQWYPLKAPIDSGYTSGSTESGTDVALGADGWRYLEVARSDTTNYSAADFSSWSTGSAPFGSGPDNAPLSGHTFWSMHTRLWLSRVINTSYGQAYNIRIPSTIDDTVNIYWNGVTKYTQPDGDTLGLEVNVTIPASDVTGSDTLVIQAVDRTVVGHPGPNEYTNVNVEVTHSASPKGLYDLNPSHIIREALTDPDWGLGYQAADINDDSFTAAADTLYTEGMGISIIWDRQIPIEDFISDILRHVDAVLYVDRVTGKFTLNLIRDDYSLSNLLILDESNIGGYPETSRATIGELTSAVTVVYEDNATGENAAVTVQDGALANIQSAAIATTIQYPGFTNFNVAARVAERDIRALSVPLLKAQKIIANREASGLNIGDPFIFSWPDDLINGVVMRVQAISYGDGVDNSITITAVEDVFSISAAADILIAAPEDGLWTDPTGGAVLPSAPRVVVEAPYYVGVVDSGQLAADTLLADEPDAGFLLAAGGRQGNEINANLLVDSGAGYVDSDVLDFSPYAYLAIDADITDTQIYYTGDVDIDVVVAGTIAQIEDELVRFDGTGTDSNGNYFTVGRGILDTVPVAHAVDSNGTAIVFWGYSPSTDGVQYTASDSLNVKIQTVLGSSVLTEASAPVDVITMDSRAIRPYPPGDLKIDALSYATAQIVGPGLDLTWVDRDRLQQTGGVFIDHTDTGIGPEAGTTYLVESDSITAAENITSNWLSENVGSATTLSIDSSYDNIPATAERLVFRVWSVRGGYQSMQAATSRQVFLTQDSNYVTPYWTPAETTTSLWLDASDLSSISENTSGQVDQWNDKSGNARHATQATASQMPISSLITQNSLNVLQFTGGSSQYFTISGLNTLTTATVFLVAKTNADPPGDIFKSGLWTFTSTGDHTHFTLPADSRIYDSFGTTLRKTTINPATTLAQWNIYGVNSRSGEWTQRINGTQTYTTASNTFGIGATSYLGRSAKASNYYYDGSIAEIVIIPDGNLSTADRQRVEGYLAWKWGTETLLPVGHLYEDAPPLA